MIFREDERRARKSHAVSYLESLLYEKMEILIESDSGNSDRISTRGKGKEKKKRRRCWKLEAVLI